MSKKCKGTGRAKGFGCGATLKYSFRSNGLRKYLSKYGLGLNCCFLDWDKEHNNGKHFQNSISKGKEKLQKEKKAQSRKNKIELNHNDPKWLNGKISTTIQAIARFIDYGQPCPARPIIGEYCGMGEKQFDGGHIFGKGAHTECKWNLHNIHRQSRNSNTNQKDDLLMRKGIAKEYGKDYANFIESLTNQPTIKKTVPELQEIYKKAKEWYNILKTSETELPKKERIKLRNQINNDLEIYPKNQSEFKEKAIV